MGENLNPCVKQGEPNQLKGMGGMLVRLGSVKQQCFILSNPKRVSLRLLRDC